MHIKKLHIVLLMLGVLATAAFAQETSGPFGLRRGMTQAQVIQIMGTDSVRQMDSETLRLRTVPKPHSAFEYYSLLFSPKDGLLKIVAYGNEITTNVFGEAVHRSFIDIRDAVSQTYGQPVNTLDYVKDGSIWKEPEDWMMGLLKDERMLMSGWVKALPNGIHDIYLEAKALSREKGFLILGYEFDGWQEYVDMKKKAAGTVF
jgi:hypothetical protein